MDICDGGFIAPRAFLLYSFPLDPTPPILYIPENTNQSASSSINNPLEGDLNMSNDQKVIRKLRAILSADVKGYSLLMADDEVHTIQTLKAYRQIMSDLIQNHSGRVVDNPGDNLLAEFSSAIDAVECAVQIQNRLKKENARYVEDNRLEFRIGVNIGDVVHDGDRIYGSGVNVAARIEGLADAGGVCISRNTYDHVKGKLDLEFEYLGEHEVKNIEEPVRAYRVLMDAESTKPLVDEQLELPDKPSIAVLPFDNMSGDPSQDYFSDGLTEQIISGLCKVSNLFVIARNSSFAYKGKSFSIKQIAKELGVKYILEGSVQRGGNSVRITAQLIDATTDYHMWSETYDRDLEDIFTLQDEITMKLIHAMEINLTVGEQARLWEGSTTNINAYDNCMKGIEYMHRNNKKDNAQARQFFQKAIELDINYAMPLANMGMAYFNDLIFGWSDNALETFDQAQGTVEKALDLDESLDIAHSVSGFLLLFRREHDKAIEVGEKAIALNPNGAHALVCLALIYWTSGKTRDSVLLMEKALRLNPIPLPMYYSCSAMAYRFNRQYDKAIEMAKKAIAKQSDMLLGHLALTASYIENKMSESAIAAAKEVIKIDPGFSLENYASMLPYKRPEDLERYINSLRKAGLPD